MTGLTWTTEEYIEQVGKEGGLVFETGTYIPSSDVVQPEILFSGSHSKAPAYIMLAREKGSTNPAGVIVWTYQTYPALLDGMVSGSGASEYGYSSQQIYTGAFTYTSSVSYTHSPDDEGSSSSAYPRYFADKTGFRPTRQLSDQYYRAGFKYKWIAIWR